MSKFPLLALGLFWRKQDVLDRMGGVPNATALTVSNVGTPLSGLNMPQDDSKQRGNIPGRKQCHLYLSCVCRNTLLL